MPNKRITHVEWDLTEEELKEMLQIVLGSDMPDVISEVNIYESDATWVGSGDEDDASQRALEDPSNWTSNWVMSLD